MHYFLNDCPKNHLIHSNLFNTNILICKNYYLYRTGHVGNTAQSALQQGHDMYQVLHLK